MKTFWRNVLGILRELADENAYRRYLLEHGAVASRESWKQFSECRLNAKYNRAKCC